MLIATLTALYLLFFSGNGGTFINEIDQVSDLVAEHVADEQRATDAKNVLAELRGALTGFPQDWLVLRQRVYEVDTSYTSTRGDYEEALRALNAAWLHRQQRVVELRFEMRDLLSHEEWDAVFTAHREMRGDG
jgi:hypothetical protein